MVSTSRIQKEILHVDNDQRRRARGDGNGRPLGAFCRRNVHSLRGVAGQVVGLVGLRIVPFVPRWAECDAWTHWRYDNTGL